MSVAGGTDLRVIATAFRRANAARGEMMKQRKLIGCEGYGVRAGAERTASRLFDQQGEPGEDSSCLRGDYRRIIAPATKVAEDGLLLTTSDGNCCEFARIGRESLVGCHDHFGSRETLEFGGDGTTDRATFLGPGSR
jgi:hypothetical protein